MRVGDPQGYCPEDPGIGHYPSIFYDPYTVTNSNGVITGKESQFFCNLS
jgi:hypothetical protein